MSRILITGDIHGEISVKRILKIDYLTEEDYVIIAGDAKIVWDKSDRQLALVEKLKKKPFTILFIDGNHENFDLLNSYKVQQWKGGNVHKIADNIYHLMRGQIFTINKKKIFTFGGAMSVDRFKGIEGVDWWEEELPSVEEMNEGFKNLDRHRYKVDYIVTHTCSVETLEFLGRVYGFKAEIDYLHRYFDDIKDRVNYRHWFFGHFHRDQYLFDNQTALFDGLIDL